MTSISKVLKRAAAFAADDIQQNYSESREGNAMREGTMRHGRLFISLGRHFVFGLAALFLAPSRR